MKLASVKNLFGPVRIHRQVENGNVLCPVRLRGMDVQRCMSCPFLADWSTDKRHTTGEIVCEPSLTALIGPEPGFD